MNLPVLQAEARLKLDIKATKTVAMAIATYYVCYIPTIAYGIWGRDGDDHVWFAFMAGFCTFISSASNPIIYVLRDRRCRSAVRQLVKDPCGTSPFQEKHVITGKEEKRKNLARVNLNSKRVGPGVSTRPQENSEGPAATKPKMFEPGRVEQLPAARDLDDVNSIGSLDRNEEKQKKNLDGNLTCEEPGESTTPQENSEGPTATKPKMFEPGRVEQLPAARYLDDVSSIGSLDRNEEKQKKNLEGNLTGD